MPIFEIETDQGVFEIDADREPTQEEALRAIAGQIPASTPRIPQTITLPEEQAVAQSLTAQERRPGPTQAIEALMTPATAGFEIAKGIVNSAREGAAGAGELLGAGSVEDTTRAPTGREQALNAALSVIPGFQALTPKQRRDVAQTALEIVPRAVYEAGQGVVGLAQQPQTALALTSPVVAAITQLIEGSRTPSEGEIQRAVESQTLSQALEQVGQQPIAPELFGEANIPAARAAPLVLGAEAPIRAVADLTRAGASRIGAVAETVGSRGVFSKPLEDAITRTTGITASEGSLEAAPIVKTRISEWPGKPPKNAKEFVEVATKAQSSVLQDALTPLRQAEKSGLVMKGDQMISSGREAVLRDFPSLANDAQAIQGVLDEFAYLRGELKPTQGQGFLRELNRRYNGLENKNSPAASAYRAIRNDLSNQTDEIIKAQTGKDISPYRDWGQIEDFKNGVQEQITAAQRTQAGRELPTGEGVPTTTRGAAVRAVRSLPVTRAFVPRAIEEVDSGIKRIFREVKSLPKAADLGEDAVNSLRAKYQPGATPPPLPVDLETQLRNLINSYPKNIRDNPALARSVAEAELSGQSTPLR